MCRTPITLLPPCVLSMQDDEIWSIAKLYFLVAIAIIGTALVFGK